MAMTRGLFLYLSTNAAMRSLVMGFPPVRKAALRFVAGETVEQAIEVVRGLNARGILATLDCLGENVTSEADATRARDQYLATLERIAQGQVQSHVSLKLTQFGLDLGEELCRANVARVVQRAREIDTFVRIDMEGSDYTERTLSVLRALRREYDNVGIVIQAYLYRSEADIRALIDEGTGVRLCKGAYQEPADKAFPRKADTDANMVKLMQIMLAPENRTRSRRITGGGAYLAMATHDIKMIEATRRFAAEHEVPRDAFEFQMLHGIRRDLQEQLARDGYRMRVYVPFGTQWYPYFMRRLAERPANVWFIAGNFFRR
jgi:proline dehydrogenase